MQGHREEHGVEPICAALKDTPAHVAPSTVHAWRGGREQSKRAKRDGELIEAIAGLRASSYCAYGSRKTWVALNRGGLAVARCTVERLMRAQGWSGLSKAKGPRTTTARAGIDYPADLVKREFQADAPNRLWVADITYVRTFAGWVYVAFVMDMFSRRIVGWQASTSLHTDLALHALEQGLWVRARAGHDVTDLVHHSDRGVQYRAVRYTERLAEADVVASVGSKGDSYDNAAAEALNSTFKAELVRNQHVLAEHGPWRSINDLEVAIAEWVDWYNHSRLHGSLGDIPPAEYETNYYAEHAPTALVGATP